MAARTRKMLIIPKHLISFSIPNKSTMTIVVSLVKAAEKKEEKIMYKNKRKIYKKGIILLDKKETYFY